jgi:hypothetical protein
MPVRIQVFKGVINRGCIWDPFVRIRSAKKYYLAGKVLFTLIDQRNRIRIKQSQI